MVPLIKSCQDHTVGPEPAEKASLASSKGQSLASSGL